MGEGVGGGLHIHMHGSHAELGGWHEQPCSEAVGPVLSGQPLSRHTPPQARPGAAGGQCFRGLDSSYQAVAGVSGDCPPHRPVWTALLHGGGRGAAGLLALSGQTYPAGLYRSIMSVAVLAVGEAELPCGFFLKVCWLPSVAVCALCCTAQAPVHSNVTPGGLDLDHVLGTAARPSGPASRLWPEALHSLTPTQATCPSQAPSCW